MSKLAVALAVLLLDSVIPQTGANCSFTLSFVPSLGSDSPFLSGGRPSVSAGRAIHAPQKFVRAALCQAPPAISLKEGSETDAVDLPHSSTTWLFQNAILLSCAAKGIHHCMLIELWRSCAGARELTSYAPVPGPMHHKWHHHKKVHKACE